MAKKAMKEKFLKGPNFLHMQEEKLQSLGLMEKG